ncbi:2'-5' RNA ligase family protein [Streptomyces sp. ET3-23]|uniref:2'-5' RNA ligase family protein n=1 Tax=Streptomyces sp. ET3-23 TaxID=2885643 RepID=UPI001D0FC489|nr:2'-5' RNA ligase family protein [Streptomyces sp. ET3-23]MCC2278020.1 2'-5' RNA ligase family protein [Streptomyces sp. ET3-23]
MSTQPETMANHWWWRPGWRPGRRFYTWHFTFQGAAEVHRLAETYRKGLAEVQGLDLVPDRWLHLTMQGLGFVDEVPEKEARAIVDAATARLRAVPAFHLLLDRPDITPEAIRWEASPSRQPADVRTAIRAAIADVWPQVPETAHGFAPHVSIAYSNSRGPVAPVAEALGRVEAEPARAHIDSVELIVLNRDHRMYEWERFAKVPLG